MKKLLSLVLAVVLIASLASCESRDKPSKDDSSSTSSSGQTSGKPVEDETQKKAKEALVTQLQQQFGKEIQANFKEKVKIGTEECFLFEITDDNSAEAYTYSMAVSPDGKNLYEKSVGGKDYLKVEPTLSPAQYYIDLLNNNYAASCVAGLNAFGNDVKSGSVATYPQDFPDKSKFPKISDTEDVIFLYKEGGSAGKSGATFIRTIVKIDATHVAVLEPSMLNASDTAGKVSFTLIEFVKDFSLDDYAKKLDCKTRVGKNVK